MAIRKNIYDPKSVSLISPNKKMRQKENKMAFLTLLRTGELLNCRPFFAQHNIGLSITERDNIDQLFPRKHNSDRSKTAELIHNPRIDDIRGCFLNQALLSDKLLYSMEIVLREF